jgi:hypothetical protein
VSEMMLVEIIWPQELPAEDIKTLVENGHYYVDMASPVLVTRQEWFNDWMDQSGELTDLRALAGELAEMDEDALVCTCKFPALDLDTPHALDCLWLRAQRWKRL